MKEAPSTQAAKPRTGELELVGLREIFACFMAGHVWNNIDSNHRTCAECGREEILNAYHGWVKNVWRF